MYDKVGIVLRIGFARSDGTHGVACPARALIQQASKFFAAQLHRAFCGSRRLVGLPTAAYLALTATTNDLYKHRLCTLSAAPNVGDHRDG